jgi:hypothetical protein
MKIFLFREQKKTSETTKKKKVSNRVIKISQVWFFFFHLTLLYNFCFIFGVLFLYNVGIKNMCKLREIETIKSSLFASFHCEMKWLYTLSYLGSRG